MRHLVRQAGRDADRKAAIRVNAKFATVVGEILFNTGDHHNARKWYLTARSAAQEAGDQYLADAALAGQTYLPTYSDEPKDALALVAPRLDRTTTPNPAVAWLWAFRAKAYASLGEKNAADRSFDHARTTLNSCPPEMIKPGIYSFLPEKLDVYRAHAYVTLRMPSVALQAADAAISRYDAAETAEPASASSRLVRFERASALLGSGEIDEACREAIAALLTPNLQQTVPIKQRAKKFDATLSGHSSPAVREWRDVLWSNERY